VVILFSLIRFNCSYLTFAHSTSSSSKSINTLNEGISTSKGITASIPIYQRIRGGSYWGTNCSAVCVKGKWQHLMPILIGDYPLLNNLLDIFVSSFYRTIHLWPIWWGIGMLDFPFRQSFIIFLALKFWTLLVIIFSIGPYRQIKSLSINFFTTFYLHVIQTSQQSSVRWFLTQSFPIKIEINCQPPQSLLFDFGCPHGICLVLDEILDIIVPRVSIHFSFNNKLSYFWYQCVPAVPCAQSLF